MLSKLGTLAGCLLCLRLVTAQISSVTSSSSVTSLQGSSGTTQSWSVEGRNNPLAFFLALGSMAPEAQKQYLNATGAQLQQAHGLACNVFGGAPSCMSLSASSKFHELCPHHDLKVDCAYYTEDEVEVEEDPMERVKTAMQAKGLAELEGACPVCFENQRALWCAQTVPKCGSYSANIENVLLPALSKVTTAQMEGEDSAQSLSAALPELLKASSLAMPCRQMCEAIITSCSCNDEQKFGSLLEAFVANHIALGEQLPRGFTTELFGSVWDLPICSFYGDSSNPAFAGTCDLLPSVCEDEGRWCGTGGKNNTAAQMVQQLMAGQVANALFGWIDAPATNLFEDGKAFIDDADDEDEKELENQYLRNGSGSQHSGSSTAAAAAHWIVFAVCIMAVLGGGFAFWRWRQRQNAATDGYLSMSAMEGDFQQSAQPMVARSGSSF